MDRASAVDPPNGAERFGPFNRVSAAHRANHYQRQYPNGPQVPRVPEWARPSALYRYSREDFLLLYRPTTNPFGAAFDPDLMSDESLLPASVEDDQYPKPSRSPRLKKSSYQLDLEMSDFMTQRMQSTFGATSTKETPNTDGHSNLAESTQEKPSASNTFVISQSTVSLQNPLEANAKSDAENPPPKDELPEVSPLFGKLASMDSLRSDFSRFPPSSQSDLNSQSTMNHNSQNSLPLENRITEDQSRSVWFSSSLFNLNPEPQEKKAFPSFPEGSQSALWSDSMFSFAGLGADSKYPGFTGDPATADITASRTNYGAQSSSAVYQNLLSAQPTFDAPLHNTALPTSNSNSIFTGRSSESVNMFSKAPIAPPTSHATAYDQSYGLFGGFPYATGDSFRNAAPAFNPANSLGASQYSNPLSSHIHTPLNAPSLSHPSQSNAPLVTSHPPSLFTMNTSFADVSIPRNANPAASFHGDPLRAAMNSGSLEAQLLNTQPRNMEYAPLTTPTTAGVVATKANTTSNTFPERMVQSQHILSPPTQTTSFQPYHGSNRAATHQQGNPHQQQIHGSLNQSSMMATHQNVQAQSHILPMTYPYHYAAQNHASSYQMQQGLHQRNPYTSMHQPNPQMQPPRPQNYAPQYNPKATHNPAGLKDLPQMHGEQSYILPKPPEYPPPNLPSIGDEAAFPSLQTSTKAQAKPNSSDSSQNPKQKAQNAPSSSAQSSSVEKSAAAAKAAPNPNKASAPQKAAKPSWSNIVSSQQQANAATTANPNPQKANAAQLTDFGQTVAKTLQPGGSPVSNPSPPPIVTEDPRAIPADLASKDPSAKASAWKSVPDTVTRGSLASSVLPPNSSKKTSLLAQPTSAPMTKPIRKEDYNTTTTNKTKKPVDTFESVSVRPLNTDGSEIARTCLDKDFALTRSFFDWSIARIKQLCDADSSMLFDYLMTVDALEVQATVASYMRDTQETSSFASEFLRRRVSETRNMSEVTSLGSQLNTAERRPTQTKADDDFIDDDESESEYPIPAASETNAIVETAQFTTATSKKGKKKK